MATVAFNYHISVAEQYYSVPFSYIKRKVDVRLTNSVVEVFTKESVSVLVAVSMASAANTALRRRICLPIINSTFNGMGSASESGQSRLVQTRPL